MSEYDSRSLIGLKLPHNDFLFNITETPEELEQIIKQHYDKHTQEIKTIIDNPYNTYIEFCNRFDKDGMLCKFMEFESIIKYLINKIKLTILTIKTKTPVDNTLIRMAQTCLVCLYNITYEYDESVAYAYLPSIYAIKETISFFDIYERTYNSDNLGAYYHSFNYQYYFNKYMDIKQIKNYIFFPTLYTNIGATDIIKIRPVPIFIVGIVTEKVYVDEFWQSPLEFFIHDINHGRRMGKNMIDYNIKEMTEFTKYILNFIKINKTDTEQIKGIKQLMKMLIFEIIHEDALAIDPIVIWNALHRGENYTYKFEKTGLSTSGRPIVSEHVIHVEGAMAYTKMKLQYQFYDDGLANFIVIPKYRYGKYIAMSAMIILHYIKNYNSKYNEYVINTYEYYLKKTASNKYLPRPVRRFKIGDDENPNNIDITCLKTGIPQNDWLDGYRRFVGEHINQTKQIIDENDPLFKVITEEYNPDAIGMDEQEYNDIHKLFF